MRLLECVNGEFLLTEDLIDNTIPPYAILSHRWGSGTEEVTHTDLIKGIGKEKAGYKKLRFCADQARLDGLRHFWVDTCCIDKSTSDEVQTSINSMFRWYRDATLCYVYLSDVSITVGQSQASWESAFRASEWFTRGWTLQELVAPTSVVFFTREGRRLGDKMSLEQQIHEITGIAVTALRGSNLAQFDVEERFKWAETRRTTREEDLAYCLLGIFGVFMPVIYGEGKANAVRRLKKEIAEATSHIEISDRRDGTPADLLNLPAVRGARKRGPRCHKCGEYGHCDDDDHCFECGEYGHYANDLHCFKCGKYGHYANDVHCFICDEYGHYASDIHCYKCRKYGHYANSCPR